MAKKENFQEYVTRTQKEIVGIESKIEEEELKKLQLEHKMQRLQNITEYKVNKSNMVAFFTNIFRRCAFRTITNNAKRFEFISIWFYNNTIIYMDDRFCWNPFLFCLVRFLFGHFNFTSKRTWISYILSISWKLLITIYEKECHCG